MQRTVAIVAAVLMAATTYAGHIVLAQTPHYSARSAPLNAQISGWNPLALPRFPHDLLHAPGARSGTSARSRPGSGPLGPRTYRRLADAGQG